jgi:uncharacterized membrane protein
MTKGRFAVCMAAVIAGTSIQPIREYRAAGTVSTQTAVIAAISFCIGLAIVLAVGWWANRPERGGSNE